jgi:ligand-binding sensor domain-containing protein
VGVFQSADTGKSWVVSGTALQNLNVRALTIWSSSVFVGTDSGIYRMAVGGGAWQAANAGLTNTNVRTLHTGLLAGTSGGGIFRSTDGITWAPENTGLTSSNIRVILGIVAIAGTDSGVFVRLNSIWTASNAGLPTHNVRALTELPGGVGSVEVAGTDSGVFSNANIFSSTSWYSLNGNLPDKNVQALGFSFYSGSSGYLFAATETGVWRRRELVQGDAILLPNRSQFGFRITPTGSVNFTLARAARVSLTAYTISGERQATLEVIDLPAGSHARHFETRLPAGLYLYELRVGELTEMQKVRLLP